VARTDPDRNAGELVDRLLTVNARAIDLTQALLLLSRADHALLLQLSTNLFHNAIVHDLPEQGTVWVTTTVHPRSAVLRVENTGEELARPLVATLAEPFSAAPGASAPAMRPSASAWRS
jgi:two-component system, OmpR family, sensor histidine kinase VanS